MALRIPLPIDCITLTKDLPCSINTKSGLSILKYTTTSATGTVAHGLTGLKADDSSSAVRWPGMIITKQIDTSTRGWHVCNTQLPGTNGIPDSTTTGREITQADPCRDNTLDEVSSQIENLFDNFWHLFNLFYSSNGLL